MKTFFITPLGIIGLLCTGFFGVKHISDASFGSPDLGNGQKAYVANCVVCHGEKGLGDGVAAQAMIVKPDDIYQELKNPLGFKAELINSVLQGDNGQNGLMPAFNEVLSESDINDIFGYLVDVNSTDCP